MSFLLCRGAVQMSLCARSSRRAGSFLLSMGLLMGLFTAAAHAVVVRGHLTDAYGKPLSGGQVRLSHGGQIVAIASAGPDGAYERGRCWPVHAAGFGDGVSARNRF
jgi:hypothetical protein